MSDPYEKKISSVGRPSQHSSAKIVDTLTGEILPWGETGEICTRGYFVMNSYWGDEAKTKEVIDSDGWIHSGDLGFFDEDGYLAVVGRSKDMIIRGGENIYPIEIEEFLLKHKSISDIHCIAVNDEKMGEEIGVWVKLRDN